MDLEQRTGSTPLSRAQEALWFLYEFAPQSPLYNMGVALQCQGRLEVECLCAALNEIARRHQSLSSVFHEHNDGTVVQRLRSNAQIGFSLVEAGDPDQRILKLLAQELISQPFDLRQQLPLRAALLRTTTNDVLVLTLHHLISDATSIQNILRELALVYADGVTAFARPARQYAEYIAFERSCEHSPQWVEAQRYWLQQLESAPRVFELPTQHARPKVRDFTGATFSEAVPDASAQQLRCFARARRLTPATVLLAAYQCQLHRYSGQTDFVIGMPVSTRTTEGSNEMVGLFVNTVALRTQIQAGCRFTDLLNDARASLLGALDHQGYPFSRLVTDLNIARDLSREPLAQVSFNYVKATQPIERFGTLSCTLLDLETAFAKNDFSFQFIDSGNAMRCVVVYDSRLFERWFVEAWYHNFLILLEAVCADPDMRLADVPLISPLERELVLHAWNATGVEFPRELCVHELFEQQVAENPDAPALKYADQQLSYAQLNQRADRLADRLLAQGVVPDTLIAVCMPRSLDLAISLLAIMKAGAGYLPLDPELPAARMAHMLCDAAPMLMLTQKECRYPIADFHGTRIQLHNCAMSDSPAIKHASPATTSQNLAYCLYTSGSTGLPKGVAMSHQAVMARLHWMQATYRLGPGDRVLQKTALGFDVSVWEYFWTLGTGACLCIPEDDDVRDVDRLVARLVDEQITFAHFTPSVLAEVLEHRDFVRNSLRFMVSGGEALPVPLFEKAMQAMSGRFHNRYGPTEAAINASCWKPDHHGHSATSIGRPLANTRMCLLDAHLNPVPIGVTGEIHIAGEGLARGYRNRADLTAERFIPDPFGAPGSRMYRTGDLGRHRSDGNIEFLGRVDHQIKVRGYRIESGEIENALRKCCGVQDAVVLADGDLADRHLVAYIVMHDAMVPPSNQVLRTELSANLPSYMVPAIYRFLPKLPLNANGKIDRAILMTTRTEIVAETHCTEPRDATEVLLAAIWKEVLKVECVGVHDNFFALGGHSLLVTRVVSRVRIATQREINVRDVFLSPTISELAQRLRSGEKAPIARAAIVPRPRPVRAGAVSEI